MAQDFQINCSSESKPLTTLGQLLDWNPNKEFFDVNDWKPYSLSRLQTHRTRPNSEFKTLLCHDMKGGYLEDRYNDGSQNEKAFSHNLVTIPPICWINASHKNGVPILGTFIVEGWTQTNEIMFQILNRSETQERVVSKLVEIAQFYHFDGWLINIECEIDPKSIESLITFVKLLTDTMHTHNRHSLVIWYDSVISPEGHLKWQNELNIKNKCFFDSCDAIFLNYCWDQQNLISSYELSHSMSRNYDVFVGIDVFGRNCFGGGGMNTNLAVKEILKHDLSIAIFASGWTHEVLRSEKFTNNEYLFWSSLDLGVHHWPQKLPIITSFCQGFGLKNYQSGQELNGNAWHNLSLQELQPTFHNNVEIHIEEAFNGGGCLRLKENCVPLFRCDFPIERCFYAITFKSNSHQTIGTTIKYRTKQNNENNLNLFIDESNLKINSDFIIEYINDYRQYKQISEKFSKYGIFETTNDWMTQAFIINKNIPQLQVIVTTIELKVINTIEGQTPDILIGQMILDSI